MFNWDKILEKNEEEKNSHTNELNSHTNELNSHTNELNSHTKNSHTKNSHTKSKPKFAYEKLPTIEEILKLLPLSYMENLTKFISSSKNLAKKYAQTKKRWRKKEMFNIENTEADFLEYDFVIKWKLIG